MQLLTTLTSLLTEDRVREQLLAARTREEALSALSTEEPHRTMRCPRVPSHPTGAGHCRYRRLFTGRFKLGARHPLIT
jgi:hypothetical protein